ncbi:DUF262 domain-containing protein [Actinomycetospora sp. CA-084318]|uniref:DUF262 domain-containing protein n=1 Tax=Actinomycetospora sp. CA-084318 TaxID=3239892 RepID=UPI003D95A425
MDASARMPRDLFDSKLIYEIPTFQRPYVWTEENQWQPLWDDVTRVAEAVEQADDEGVRRLPAHFLGAVVVKQAPALPGDLQRYAVIDGQQRLTTLQVLLDAAAVVIAKHGHDADAESIEELILNKARRFAGTPERFKLRPSRVDRAAFEAAMDDDVQPGEELRRSQIVGAHDFFLTAIEEWASESTDPASRLSALTHVLRSKLGVVSILLAENDDEQLIFETLNDRGTPLLGADLIKNHVFGAGERLQADVDRWNEEYWRDLDDGWWRERVSQGRLYRSRIDLFVQYWLTMRTRQEIYAEEIAREFREYASEHFTDLARAEALLREFRRDADTFREFAQMDTDSPRGRFYSVVVENLELGATTPLLLWLISRNRSVPTEQIDRALGAVESWAVRRTLLRRVMKDVNKMVVALLDAVESAGPERAGDETVAFLSRQSSDARVWPTDREVLDELPTIRAYGNINQRRLRLVLGAIERYWRTAWHGDVSLPDRLDIEHVMPRRWRNHWAQDVASDPERASRRDRLVDTIGNLTLVTRRLNASLSDRAWQGTESRPGKHDLLERFNLFVLNKKLLDGHAEEWTDDDIVGRSLELAGAVVEMWPRDPAGIV